MDAITISVTIGEDRKLVVELPPEVPVGKAELTIKPAVKADEDIPLNPTREALRAKLLAAGRLATNMDVPINARSLTNEELAILGQMPPDARPSEDLIDEDRGEY
ncbi:MAG: hypothetical protein KF716_19205 [Anaerolineae bacterium]|nr:hypothetical protein [Anaerolineae bacterium]